MISYSLPGSNGTCEIWSGSSVAHLIAAQTRRSFYSIAPADVPTAERLEQVFARAHEHSPSILFIDELDGLLPRGDNGYDKYLGPIPLAAGLTSRNIPTG